MLSDPETPLAAILCQAAMQVAWQYCKVARGSTGQVERGSIGECKLTPDPFDVSICLETMHLRTQSVTRHAGGQCCSARCMLSINLAARSKTAFKLQA